MVLPPTKSYRTITIEDLVVYIQKITGYPIVKGDVLSTLNASDSGRYFEVYREDISAYWKKTDISDYSSDEIVVITAMNIIFNEMLSDEMILLRI